MLTHERLKELLSYDPATGEFRRILDVKGGKTLGFTNARAGDIAGAPRKDGYWRISIDNKRYFAHRLAFLYMTGAWPKRHVDHRDGNPSNNAWQNLREASHAENMRNSKPKKHSALGVKGVRRTEAGNYSVRITINRKVKHLGTTHNLALAGYMYRIAAAGYHGDFARAA